MFYDRSMQELKCEFCGERQLMVTVVIYNPYRYVAAVEKFAQDHKDCPKFKSISKARAARRWAREMRKLNVPERKIRLGVIAEAIVQRKPASRIRKVTA